MRAFVTGAIGSIGWPLVDGLLERGHQVRVRLRTRGQAREGIAEILKRRGVDVVTDDADEGDGLQAALAGCDAVFHLAWQADPGSDPDFADGTPESCIERNLDGVRTIIDAARAAEVRRLVFLSTALVYGTASFGGVQPLDESAPVISAETIADRHWHNHAVGKVLAERLILDAPDLEPVILRPSPVYGPYQRGTLAVIWQMLGENQTVFPHLLQWIYGDDLVDALIRAGTLASVAHPVFNIAATRGAPSGAITEAVRTIADCLYKAQPFPDIDAMLPPATMAFDIRRAQTGLEFSPAVPWSHGLAHAVAQALYGDPGKGPPLDALFPQARSPKTAAAAP